jgi:hypothetical protein
MIQAGVQADAQNEGVVHANLYIRVFGAEDRLTLVRGPQEDLAPGTELLLSWQTPDTSGAPIAEVGIEITSEQRANGALYLDYLGWQGVPDVIFLRPNYTGKMWRYAWVNGLDHEDRRELSDYWQDEYRIIQDEGRGLLIQGTREWTNYRFSAVIRPHQFKAGGIGVHVQGMRRYYALLLKDESCLQLVKVLDGEHVLAEVPFDWKFGDSCVLGLAVTGNQLTATIGGQVIIRYQDEINPIMGGAVALICEEGRFGCDHVSVHPV